MPSPRSSNGEKELRELSRVRAAQLATYAAERLKLQQPNLLTPRDRAHLAAADAALEEIRKLLLSRQEEVERALQEQEG
jgi:hypothetical protein